MRLCLCKKHYSFTRLARSLLAPSPFHPVSSPRNQVTSSLNGVRNPIRLPTTTFTQITNQPHPCAPALRHTKCVQSLVSRRYQSSSPAADMEVVYVAPLKGAVRAIKVFSLTTATGAFFGGPVLVWLGNPSVPLAGRLIMSTLVMLVGLGTTGLLHWLVKGYVMKMEHNRQSGEVMVHTLSIIGTLKKHKFNITEAGPPSKATAFSSFQAKGKSYFMHTEVFEDRKLLTQLLGAYSVFEEPKMWTDVTKT